MKRHIVHTWGLLNPETGHILMVKVTTEEYIAGLNRDLGNQGLSLVWIEMEG